MLLPDKGQKRHSRDKGPSTRDSTPTPKPRCCRVAARRLSFSGSAPQPPQTNFFETHIDPYLPTHLYIVLECIALYCTYTSINTYIHTFAFIPSFHRWKRERDEKEKKTILVNELRVFVVANRERLSFGKEGGRNKRNTTNPANPNNRSFSWQCLWMKPTRWIPPRAKKN